MKMITKKMALAGLLVFGAVAPVGLQAETSCGLNGCWLRHILAEAANSWYSRLQDFCAAVSSYKTGKQVFQNARAEFAVRSSADVLCRECEGCEDPCRLPISLKRVKNNEEIHFGRVANGLEAPVVYADTLCRIATEERCKLSELRPLSAEAKHFVKKNKE
ncbi:MAG: hypothetical protein M1549_03630 [Candidatus Dependentiae bacterium]|jgi:hypothetical protein|nr:hypothetical protein [Candidatus Dependentiae bacterium]